MFKRKGSFESDGTNTVNIKCQIFIDNIELLNQHFGHSRFVYNWAINYNTERHKNKETAYNFVNLAKLLPQLKEENDFLRQVDSTCLQQALQDYWTTMKNFLKKKGGFPSYRNKHQNQTFRMANVSNRIRFSEDGKNIKLGKFGWVRIKPNQMIPDGTIQFVTIKRTKAGKVYATLTIRRVDKIEPLSKTGKEVGIDVGISSFATFSDGRIIERPYFLNDDEKKKRKLQRKLSHQVKGSSNYEKTRKKLAKFCEKDANRRDDFTHKLALDIVRNYDFIAVEHLDIKGMLKSSRAPYSKKLHKSISKLGWYSFISKVKYKSKWYGKTFVQVDTYFPSSQLCSNCGYKNTDVKNLSVRHWNCPNCNTSHDRDLNAATNILNEGKRLVA